MSLGLVPAWMRDEREEFAAARAAQQEKIIANLTIKANGATFWAKVCSELELVAMHVPEGINSRFHHAVSDTSSEDHCRIEISYMCSAPRINYADLWYCPGGDRIRYWATITQATKSLQLCFVRDEILAFGDDGAEPMTPEQVARFLARPMVKAARVAA